MNAVINFVKNDKKVVKNVSNSVKNIIILIRCVFLNKTLLLIRTSFFISLFFDCQRPFYL